MGALALALILGQTVPIETIMARAEADAARLPADIRTYTRYLELGHYHPKDRPDAIQLLMGHVNQLSVEPDIVPLQIVPMTEGALVRLNLLDYGWKTEVWEKFAKSDPYHHVHFDGVDALGPMGNAAHAKLATWTQSAAPILLADWFFNQTAASYRRSPNYYDFLGIKDERALVDFIGYSSKDKSKYNLTLREAIADSGVTLQPRGIARQRIKGGAYWYTLDFDEATKDKNPLVVYGRDIEKNYSATEVFFHLPNGMWGTGLFNKQGVKQDFAPPEIASDHRSRSNDARVHVNVSCYRCHDNAGLQDLDPWVQRLLKKPLVLNFADYKEAVIFRQEYAQRLFREIGNDRAAHAQAVKQATGMEVKAYHGAYGRFWETYEDARIDAVQAAMFLRTNEKDFVTALKNYAGGLQNLNPLLSGFIDGKRIRVRQWEEAYPLALAVMAGAGKIQLKGD